MGSKSAIICIWLTSHDFPSFREPCAKCFKRETLLREVAEFQGRETCPGQSLANLTTQARTVASELTDPQMFHSPLNLSPSCRMLDVRVSCGEFLQKGELLGSFWRQNLEISKTAIHLNLYHFLGSICMEFSAVRRSVTSCFSSVNFERSKLL